VLIASIPQIPDRTAAFRGVDASPLAALISSGRRLVCAGAKLIIMPCNTAHLWYADLQGALRTPMLHIVDAALEDVMKRHGRHARVGLLATAAPVQSGMYARRAAPMSQARAIDWIVPTTEELHDSPAIAAVKAGNPKQAMGYFAKASHALVQRGATCVVMGCTEVPLARNQGEAGVPLVDATDALARGAILWSRTQNSR
jgi:aspartate racemase